MNPDLDPAALVERLRAHVDSPANKLLVAHLVADVTRVAATAITDPAGAEREMGFIRAATANLAAAEAAKVQSEIVEWLGRLIRAAIVGA